MWKAVFPSPFTPGGHNTNKYENSSSLNPAWLCLNPPPTQSSQQLWGPGVPKVTCQCQVYSAVLAPRPKACTGEGGMRVVECGCLTSQLTHLRSWGQNVLRGRGRRLRLQEAVPWLQICSLQRCLGEVRPTIRPPCLPFRPTRPAAPTGTPNTRAWPHARPRTLTSRSRPCLLRPPLRTGRGRRGAVGGSGAEHASVALGTGGGALACSCVTETRPAPAKERHPMGVPPRGCGHAQLRPHSQGRNKPTLA